MDEAIPPAVPNPQNGARMSLSARLTNIFSNPGDVFGEVVKGPPSTANWLVPALLWCVVGIVSAMIIFSQDAAMQQIREKQERSIEKKLEKAEGTVGLSKLSGAGAAQSALWLYALWGVISAGFLLLGSAAQRMV